jgi:alkanesulfonate monooxygenase SsuD/methylene tetrahydromethanopterin reductase-like flavin-dependent oxidoreductase (luciferase family)
MQFGLQSPIYTPLPGVTPADNFTFHMDFAKTMVRTGYDVITVGNHFLEGPNVQLFQPFIAAAAYLTRFPELYVMSSIYVLPYQNPVVIAQEIASLDAISPGGFLFGIGQGYRTKEAHALGIDNSKRAPMMAESIKALRMLWSDGPSDFTGEFFQFSEADIGMRPSAPGGPPILIAADKLRTVERVPQVGGDHWLPSPRHSEAFLHEALPAYKRGLEKAGRHFEGIVMQRDVSIGKSMDDAEALIRDTYETIIHNQSKWGQPGERYDMSFDDLKDGRILLGTPEQVAEKIVELHHTFDVRYLNFRIQTSGMEPSRALEVVAQLGEEVLPLVRAEVKTDGLFPSRNPAANR